MRRCLVLICLLLFTSACQVPETDAIRFGLASAPTNLDPRFATDASSERITRLLYVRLVDFDAHVRPTGSLAEWTVLNDTHYRFKLRAEGRLFHDGSRLGAADVAATYRSVLDPETASPHRGTLTMIERIAVIDDDTLDFHLKQADALFPGFLTLGILPAKRLLADHPFHEHPIGSGPFRLLSWENGDRLVLQRQTDQQTVVFETIKDPTMRVLKLLRGEIDIVQNDLPPELLRYLDEREGIEIKRAPGSNFTYLGFNLQDPATGKQEIRRAIALAIDRQAIIDHIFHSAARPASSLLPPEHWAGDKNLPLIEHDIAQAGALLAQAGFNRDSNPLYLSYKTSSDPFRLRLAAILQQQLAQIGVRVKIESYDWGTFYGDIKAGRFQMYSLAWVGIKSPDIFRYAFHSESLPPEGANRGRLSDAEVDQLIVQAGQSGSLEHQAAQYRLLQHRLQALLPYIPLWYEDQYAAMHARIKGYTVASDGAYDALIETVRIH